MYNAYSTIYSVSRRILFTVTKHAAGKVKLTSRYKFPSNLSQISLRANAVNFQLFAFDTCENGRIVTAYRYTRTSDFHIFHFVLYELDIWFT